MRFRRVADFDLWEQQEAPERDENLRRMVDALAPEEAHMVSRVYFGQATIAMAGKELKLTRSKAETILNRGLKHLQIWIEQDYQAPSRPLGLNEVDVEVAQCGEETEWGRCQQPQQEAGLCAAHLEWVGRNVWPDPAYERDVVLGVRVPIQAVLSVAEMEAVLNGRLRGDGRRIDAYVAGEPLGIEL